MQKPVDWLHDFFTRKGWLPDQGRDEQLSLDIFDAALIDSFGIVELISEIESVFKFELKAEDMQDKRFRTIRGIAEIIGERLSDNQAFLKRPASREK